MYDYDLSNKRKRAILVATKKFILLDCAFASCVVMDGVGFATIAVPYGKDGWDAIVYLFNFSFST